MIALNWGQGAECDEPPCGIGAAIFSLFAFALVARSAKESASARDPLTCNGELEAWSHSFVHGNVCGPETQ